MALSLKFTIMCDDVRQENTGKLMLIGMYMGNITVTQLPFVLPTLTFFQQFEVDRPGNYTLRVQMQDLDQGRTITQAVIMMDVQQAAVLPGPAINVVKFGGVQFERAGSYMLSTMIDGQNDLLTFPFDVVLNVARPFQLQQGPFGPIGPR
jgi:hypothetical protein